jgi:hypothetical protein
MAYVVGQKWVAMIPGSVERVERPSKVTQNEARRRKEVALAGTRELQLRVLEGKLLSRDTVVKVWAEAYHALRDKMLTIPDRTAAALALCQSEAECRRIVRSEIEDALSSLASKPIFFWFFSTGRR